jgi:hypothetical protein
MVNATRASKGLGTLAKSEILVGIARAQADKMAAKGNIFHNLKLGDQITASGLDWRKAGENVGMGPSVDLVEEAFLKSPHHYENIVDPTYTAVGIGVVDGADGRRYVVQVFANLRTAAAPAPAPTAKPATQTPQAPASTAPQAVPVQTTTHAASAPAPVVPAPGLTADPNAVIGGVIEPLDLGL